MKKFMLVLTVAAVLFGAFALTGCNGKNATESYRNVYLVSAIAGANYLQQSADASDFYAGVSADGSYFASARGRVGAVRCGHGKRFRRNGGQTGGNRAGHGFFQSLRQYVRRADFRKYS